jgi:Protein of unknown function (DUF1449)
MFDLLASPPLQVFSILAAFVGLLVLVELMLMLIGMSSDLGIADADMPGTDTGVLSPDATLTHLDAAMIESLDPDGLTDTPTQTSGGASGTFLAALGLGEVPAVLWLAILGGTIAAQGFFLQIAFANTIGWMLPALLALAITLPGAFWITRKMSRLIGRLVPQSESYAISAHSFNRRRGVVVVGTARTGNAAEVRFSDSFGTLHYIMCEPLDPADVISAGTDVVILRTRDGKPRIVALQ